MKFLLLLSLGALALAGEDQMVNNWQKLKAMESCWGEENMKLYTVNMKKAIAKCSHEDAPELSLAPFRSTYRFVNAMLSSADKMENQQNSLIEKMLEMMQGNQYNSRRPSYSSYSRHGEGNNYMEKMKNKFFMKQMMQKMMNGDMYESKSPMTYGHMNNNEDFREMFNRMFGNNMENRMDNFGSNSDSSMSQFFDMFRSRSKRAASEEGVVNPSLDLGDRLVEKLNEQRQHMEAKIGNMTCVLKDMGCLNNNNEIDLRGMKEEMQQYTMPSPWFVQKYELILDTCYEMTEYQLFPLVIQLLHGEEMEYMMADF